MALVSNEIRNKSYIKKIVGTFFRKADFLAICSIIVACVQATITILITWCNKHVNSNLILVYERTSSFLSAVHALKTKIWLQVTKTQRPPSSHSKILHFQFWIYRYQTPLLHKYWPSIFAWAEVRSLPARIYGLLMSYQGFMTILGYIDVGDECGRRNALVKTIRCWWRFGHFGH